MQNKFALIWVAATALHVVSASAENISESLTRIEAETLVLKARERQLEIQSNIVTRQNEIAVKQNMTTAITQPVVVGDPVIRAIEGVGTKIFATLQLSDGSVVDVQQGDTLSNGMKVVSVTPREVVVMSKSNQRIRLGTYVQQNVGFNSGFTGTALGLPAVPTRSAAR
ncbi:pilus assembly protein PilP [Herbaspirillum rubrisubalbicans]|uniref:Pilus assembly protein PilP n=1 Tax=Herbaspirillum rubrisubalbicans TaxID=80842 RepID=A0ABX9C8X8_9BURK|nr:type IV pilus biogenesis protein PilP [Herbaspirillum rubrisubalbicans]MCP1572615.1 type IV pilus biogenesis protein PilP [Herbaspirillum rubrisubalbicans]RAM67051.1 pilus assembly protein PilP [Herbaspirillum rubrisubalbicans]RAN49083.1 pilus assembly protein PilP [Herbaspirillum rubrisubalbicans]